LYSEGSEKWIRKLFCVLLLINSLAIGVIIQSVNANPYLEHKIAAPPEDAKAFTITVVSPKENAVYSNTNHFALVFNVTASKSQTALTTYITRVQYRGDWMPNAEFAYQQDFASPEFPSFWEFSLNLTGIPAGRHNIIITANGGGGYAEGLTWYNFNMDSSSSVNFIIGEENLTTAGTASPAIPITIITMGVGVAILVYLKKKH